MTIRGEREKEEGEGRGVLPASPRLDNTPRSKRGGRAAAERRQRSAGKRRQRSAGKRRQRSAGKLIHTDSKSNIQTSRDCVRGRAPYATAKGPTQRTCPASSTVRGDKPLRHLRACGWCLCGLRDHDFAHLVVAGERLLAHALIGERAEHFAIMFLLPQGRGAGVCLRREPLHQGRR